jgi:DNA-binding MarR family transcriptional regulator
MKKEDKTISIDRIVENIFTIHPLISKTLGREIKAKLNLSPGVLLLVKLLYKHEFLSMKEIGNKLMVPKSNATVLVDKLIAENMVERFYDESDRRVVNIRLTEEGKAYYQMIKQTLGQELRIRIQTLDEKKIDQMLEASQFVRDTLSEVMTDLIPPDCCCSKKEKK